MKRICEKFDVSRTAFYEQRKARARRTNRDDFVLLLARRERMVNPMAGCKKVLFAIRPKLAAEGVSMGINRFGRLMKDNGLQVKRRKKYGSHAYRGLLAAHGWKSSMTEELHCYENGMAERLNGILKGEYFLDRHFRTKAEARKAIEEAIWIYNGRRLREKCGYKTPQAFREEQTKKAA